MWPKSLISSPWKPPTPQPSIFSFCRRNPSSSHGRATWLGGAALSARVDHGQSGWHGNRSSLSWTHAWRCHGRKRRKWRRHWAVLHVVLVRVSSLWQSRLCWTVDDHRAPGCPFWEALLQRRQRRFSRLVEGALSRQSVIFLRHFVVGKNNGGRVSFQTKLKVGPPLIWVFGHFWLFAPWYRRDWEASSVKIL